ncbi:MAG: methyltransferase domain-containing protein [Verrucomicrobia bacterium]|nr:methyltransferase domain-containing protein [Verrucomicrobiota bacterium]
MVSSNVAPRYLLGNDAVAAKRLRVLDEVYHSTTVALLERAGLRTGWRCADIGCGTGLVTLTMAERVGATGSVVGVDQVQFFLDAAREQATEHGLANASFVCSNAYELAVSEVWSPGFSRQRQWEPAKAGTPNLPEQPASFDLVYARCLLSHLNEPLRALQAMAALARPGGSVVIEDIDCGGVFAHPDVPVLMRHLDLYQRVMRLNGGDPLIGRKLPRLCRKAGLSDVRYATVRPIEPAEPVKRLYPLTLACLKPAIVEAALATGHEIDALVAELNAMADDPATTVSSCPMVQVWARKS